MARRTPSLMPAARPGVSLIEIIVVVVIIGILFVVSFQSFQNSRDRSNNAQIEGNVKLVAQALLVYEADNERFPWYLNPPVATDAPTGVAVGAAAADGQPCTVMLERNANRQFLPGNLMPKQPWTQAYQANNLNVTNNAALKLSGAQAVPAPPAVITFKLNPQTNPPVGGAGARGQLPPAAAGASTAFTSPMFGSIAYETRGPSRALFVLYGVGKRNGEAKVVSFFSNAF